MSSPRLAVHEAGTGGALVVFVHGVLDRGASFAPVAERLGHECRTVWYDRRGYGASAGEGVPVDVHITDLVTVLHGRPAVVVGHSFGGVIAMGAAVRSPELVRALVLYETSVAWAPGWDDTVMAGVFGHDDPEGAAMRLMLGERYDALSDRERGRRRRHARTFLAEERSVRTGAPPYDVSAIRAPLVYGQGDPGVMAVVVRYLRRRVPSMEIVAVPGAGHFAHRSAPDAFAALVRRGLALAAAAP